MKTAEEIKKGLECRIRLTERLCDGLCSKCQFSVPELSYKEIYCVVLKYIQQLEAQVPKWISVEERLPENDANYLVFTSAANEVDLATYYGDGEWLAPDLCNLTRFVTHWMPLPEAPKEG